MQEFEYSAFISYRNGKKDDDTRTLKKDLCNEFAMQLHEALSSELGTRIDTDNIFLDHQELKGAVILEVKIGNALCQSLCYVVVFTSNYFSKKKLFCTAEFMGMLELEQQRNAILGWENSDRSFIIPVIMKGEHKVPDILKKRACKDFTSFSLSNRKRIIVNSKYDKLIREIADYIEQLHDECTNNVANLLQNCTAFTLKDIVKDKAELEQFIDDNNLIVSPFRLPKP